MKPVFYMSYSDNAEIEGLIFPSELSEDTYAPGLWVVTMNANERLPDTFAFGAVDNGELQTLEMIKINGSIFFVETKYGKVYFIVRYLPARYRKYNGNSKLITSESRLRQIVPMNTYKLHRMCLENKFFFVGRVDKD